jgi:hypothetical protein
MYVVHVVLRQRWGLERFVSWIGVGDVGWVGAV